MEKLKFSKEKPTESGWYLVKQLDEVLVTEIIEEEFDCTNCDERSPCKRCNGTGYMKVFMVNHPSYYKFVASQPLNDFHTFGMNAKTKEKLKHPDMWSEKLNF